jgi:hypothetical protein
MRADVRSGNVAVRLGRRFGMDDARRLQLAAAIMGPGARVVLDFTGTREFEDAALDALAQTLRGLGSRATLCGLSGQQRRMLRYFGVPDRRTGASGP